MKLYFSPGACSLSPHIVLRETGLPFELVKVDLKAKQYAGGDFRAVNPKGYVPVLELDDGRRLTEGPAIVQYVADQKPDTGLAPAPGSFERYQLMEWLNFISTELHKQFSPLFNPNASADWKQAVTERIRMRFAWIDSQLEGRDYLLGSTFTAADAYLFVMLNWATNMKMDLSGWPRLTAFYERVGARPAVREAKKAETAARQ